MRRPSEEVLLEVAKKFGEQPRLADRAAQRRSRSEKRWLREEKCLREETAGEEIAQRRGRSETGRPTEENGQKRGSLHHAREELFQAKFGSQKETTRRAAAHQK